MKPQPNTEIVDFTTRNLTTQLSLGAWGTQREEIYKQRLMNDFALGYIFGFSFGTFLAFGKDETDEKIPMAKETYSRLFGQIGPEILKLSCQRQEHNPAFNRGKVFGENESSEILNDQKLPLGLANYLLGKKLS